MVQTGSDSDFLKETLASKTYSDIRIKNLDCDGATELRVVRKVNGAHGPSSDLSLKLEALTESCLKDVDVKCLHRSLSEGRGAAISWSLIPCSKTTDL